MDEDPGRALVALLQPDAVVLAAHGRAIAGQAKRVAVGTRQAFQAAVGIEPDQATFALALDYRPVAAEVGGIERVLEGAARRGASSGGCGRVDEALFGKVLAGLLDQLVAVHLQQFVVIAVEVHPPVAVFLGHKTPFTQLEPVAVVGFAGLLVDLPLEVGTIGQQGFAQLAFVGCGIDCRLVDPDAAGVGGGAGAAAKHGRAEQQRESVTHDGFLPERRHGPRRPVAGVAYSRTRMASISTWEPRGRAATPMAARAG
ncbi:hypothetical protein D3C84_759080 [compost metagenome]